jgi:hypothetical protein
LDTKSRFASLNLNIEYQSLSCIFEIFLKNNETFFEKALDKGSMMYHIAGVTEIKK